MGYILLLVLGGAAAIVILAALVGGKKRAAGRTAPGHDVTYKKPAAEEANPAASRVAPEGQAERAERRTPPA